MRCCLLFFASCTLALGMTVFAEENPEESLQDKLLHERELQLQEREILFQQHEAGMQCDLELLDQEQRMCGCRLDGLERDEQLLEQQTAYRQLEQRQKEEALQKRRQREARWERDHSRE